MTVHAAGSSMRCMGHLMCRSLTGGGCMSGNTERTDDYVQAACAWFLRWIPVPEVFRGHFVRL